MKKLTESDFCSAEHRKLFMDEQQRLMLERLSSNRARILKKRGSLAVPANLEAEVPAEETAPSWQEISETVAPGASDARLCEFLNEGVYPKAHLAPPRYRGEAAAPDVRMVQSVLSLGIPAAGTGIPRPLPVFLGALASRQRYAVRALSAVQQENAGAVAGREGLRLPTEARPAQALRAMAGPFRMRPRGPLSCSAVPQFSPIHTACEPLAGGIFRPRLGLRGAGEQPLQFLDRFFRPRARGPVDSTPGIHRIAPDLLGTRIANAWPALPAAGARQLCPPLLDRPFRMRPRNGVPSIGLAPFASIPVEPVRANPAQPAYTSLPVAGPFPCGPPALDNPFRMRPRGPVQDTGRVRERAGEGMLHAAGPHALPALPASQPGSCIPAIVDRHYKLRPKGPVLDNGLSESQPIGTGEWETLASPPLLQSRTPEQASARTLVSFDHPVVSRARGPVGPQGPSGFESGPVREGALLSSPALPSLPLGTLGAGAPAFLEKLYRMRPRTGVADLQLRAFDATSTQPPAAMGSLPAVPEAGLSLLIRLSPAQLEKLYRMRPKAGVQDPGMALSQPIASFFLEARPGAAVQPSGLAAAAALSPAFVEQLYRMKPRAGVLDAALAERENIAKEYAEPVAAHAIAPAHLNLATSLAPAFLEKLYRMRPRSGVSDPKIALCHSMTSVAAELRSTATTAWPSGLRPAASLCPTLLDRLYRMKPRAGVTDAGLAVQENIWEGSADLLPSHAIPGAGLSPEAGLAPALLHKLFRMRPRAGVPDASLASRQNIEAVRADFRRGHAVPPAGLGIGTSLSPTATDRLYRMRPRAGVTDGKLRTIETTGKTNGLLPLGLWAIPALRSIASCEPAALNHCYRMRPRTGVPDHSLSEYGPIPEGNGEPLLPEPWIPSAGLGCAASLRPKFLDRAFRARPRGPVQKRGSAGIAALSPGSSAVRVSALPALPPPVVSACSPLLLDRAYRMRPRGPVAARSLAAFEPIQPGGAITMAPAASLPDMPALTMEDRTPVILKPARRGPGGPAGSAGNPVTGGTAGQEQLETGSPVAFSVVASLPSLLPGAGTEVELTPVFRDRLFLRRLSACMAATATAVNVSAREIAVEAAPLMPRLATASGAYKEPRFVNRLYRIRASAPVAPQAAAPLQACEVPEPQAPLSLLVIPAHRIVGVPGLVNRLYRIRPRSLSYPLALRAIAVQELPIEIAAVKPSIRLRSIPVQRPVLAQAREAFARYLQQGVWGSAMARWSIASPNFKLAGFALIVLFGILLTAKNIKSEPQVRRDAETASIGANPLPSLTQALSLPLAGVREQVLGLSDDFGSGLDRWSGNQNWAAGWSYAENGGVRPGPLSLFTPSRGLRDYDFEFAAEIERRAASLVYRATDLSNYSVIKIIAAEPGIRPTAMMERYSVIGGRETARRQVAIPFPAGPNRLYRGRLEVKGQFFTLSLEGKIVDFWSDDRLSSGGVGLFSAKGERARIQKIRVARQDNALEKLCAYLELQK